MITALKVFLEMAMSKEDIARSKSYISNSNLFKTKFNIELFPIEIRDDLLKLRKALSNLTLDDITLTKSESGWTKWKVNLPASFGYAIDTSLLSKEFVKIGNKTLSLKEALYNNINFIIQETEPLGSNRININRIHFSKGIPDHFKGIGLAYKIYEKVALETGWITTSADSTLSIQAVWRKLRENKLFYVIGDEENLGIFSKEKFDPNIIKDWVNIYLNDYEVCSELLLDYPNIRELLSYNVTQTN